MNILITGAGGFVGRNLAENLKNIRDGKNRTRPGILIENLYEYDIGTEETVLEDACRSADFVFHLAGVNRSADPSDFMNGNVGFGSLLLETLKKYHNSCPVMLSSSVQAALSGRYEGSEYGMSKLAAEKLFFEYAKQTGSRVLVYRFPNLFGKWCRPDYNSAVATFCNAAARDKPYTVADRSTQIELLYIDDLMEEMLDALEGREHRCEYPAGGSLSGLRPKAEEQGRFCYVPVTYPVTLGEIADLLEQFRQMPAKQTVPELSEPFVKKLYSTYMSYLPESKIAYPLQSAVDERGNFTELMRTLSFGQISVNIARPGAVRGQHWHNSKCEIFMVVSGYGMIQQRRIGIDPATGNAYPVMEFEVTGDEIRAVQILPGYTHNIINLSDTKDLVTVMWANEEFVPEHPDTYAELVNGSHIHRSVDG